MNDKQNQVMATTVCGLLLVVLFLCPWRAESTEEIRWSPIYQPPMTWVRSYDTRISRQDSSSIESEEAHIAYDLLALEVLVVAVAGVAFFFLFAGVDKTDNPVDPHD